MGEQAQAEEDETEGGAARHGARRKGRRWLRALGWSLLALCLLLGAAAGGAALYLPGREIAAPGWLAERIETRLEEALPGLTLDVGEIAFIMEYGWRPQVRLRNVDLSREGGGHLIALSHADTSLSLRALMHRQIRPREIQLSGAFLTLRRDSEGAFDLAIPESGAVLAHAGDLSGVARAVDRTLGSPLLSKLRRAGARALTIRYEDARSGRAWTVDGGRLRLERDRGEVQIAGDFALLGGGDTVTTLSLTFESARGSPSAEVGVSFEDMPAGDIAAQSPALAWLGALRAPISGSLRAGADAEGRLLPMNAVLEIGEGVLQPTDETRPVPFEAARAYASYQPATGRLQFDEVSVTSAWVTAQAEGSAVLNFDPGGWPHSMLGQFTLTGIEANPEGVYPQAVSLDRADMDFRLSLDPFRLELGQMTLEEGGRPLRLRGTLAAAPEGWDLSLDADLEEAGPQRVLSYWPKRLKPKTRRWVQENILGGRLRNGHLALRAKPGQTPGVHLNFDFEDTSLLFMKTMPPVEGASGHMTISGHRMVVVAESGQVRAAQGGMVDASGTTLTIPDLRIDKPPARVVIQAESTVTAALALLDNEPFEFLSKAGQPVTLADGHVRLEADLGLLLKKDLEPDEVSFAVAGEITDMRSETLVEGRVLAAPRLEVTADAEALRIAGQGRLGRVPFDGSWSMPLGQGPGQPSRVAASLELSERFVDEFKVGLPPGAVSGSGSADVEVVLEKDKPATFTLTSDLAGVGLRIDPLGWGLARGSRGRLEIAGELGRPPRLDRVVLDAPGLDARGRVTLDAKGGLEQAVFDRVRAGGWLDAPVRLTGRGRGAPPAVTIAGGMIDMRQLPDTGGGGAGGSGGGPVRLDLDRLQITEGIALTGMSGSFQTAHGIMGDFTGRVNGEAPVAGRVVPQNGRSAFQIRSSDAGETLRAAGLLRQARGGQMELTLAPRGGEGEFRGQLRVTNTRLKDAPAMAALLNAISIVGLLEQLGGEGIHFAEVDADFRLTPEQVVVTRSSAVGPSMGLSLDGYYNLGSKQMDFQGVLSPVYLLNGIGSILTRKGEGLIGFNFGLRGSADRPRVSVNPLSVLTPGMFREIFRRRPPEPSQ
ncbi:hypothetical protein E0K89_021970 [Aquicoccus sp. SCR17]|nr:hypothetical protein [Carideicomes alvinocaridis]